MKVTGPLRGAVHVYQTDTPPRTGVNGSFQSALAFTFVPETLPSTPLSGSAPKNPSFGGPTGGGGGGSVAYQLRFSGVGSTFPAASTAATSNVCQPTARPVYRVGETQSEEAAPSSEQRKVAVGSSGERNQ